MSLRPSRRHVLALLALGTALPSRSLRARGSHGARAAATSLAAHHQDQPMTHEQRGTVVILGASYAAGWRLGAIAGRPVINKGVQGQQSWEMLERFDRDVVALRPSAVILWGYINDVFRSSRGDIDAAKARARASYEQMIARARTEGIEVILATEVTIRAQDSWSETLASWVGWAMGKESYQAYINGHVSDLNNWLKALAEREGLLLLDLQPALAGPDGQRQKAFASEDGSHITSAGYDALTARVAPLLERHFRQGRARSR